MLGTDAMTADALALPVETILQIPRYCLGTGGASPAFYRTAAAKK